MLKRRQEAADFASSTGHDVAYGSCCCGHATVIMFFVAADVGRSGCRSHADLHRSLQGRVRSVQVRQSGRVETESGESSQDCSMDQSQARVVVLSICSDLDFSA